MWTYGNPFPDVYPGWIKTSVRHPMVSVVVNPKGEYDCGVLLLSELNAPIICEPQDLDAQSVISCILDGLSRNAFFFTRGSSRKVRTVTPPYVGFSTGSEQWDDNNLTRLSETMDASVARFLLGSGRSNPRTLNSAGEIQTLRRLPTVLHLGRGTPVITYLDPVLREEWLGRKFPGVFESLDILDRLNNRIEEALKEPMQDFQSYLLTLEGKSFESFEANHTITTIIQRTASQLRLAFACAKEGCGHAAKLRCKSGKAHGAFIFEHSVGGKQTFHGGRTTFPPLRLIYDAPPSGSLYDPDAI